MSTNQYGLDADYFRRKLERVLRDVNSYRPDEMARELARMARTADEKVLREPEFSLSATEGERPMTIAPASRITDDQLAELSDRHSIPAEALQVLRHIADLYSGGAIEGDPTQLFTTGHYVWLARRALEQIVARSQQPAPVAQEPSWGSAKTIGNLIAQLSTLDPSMPIYAPLRLDDGRVSLNGLTLSKEWKTGRFIQPGEDAERVAVLWTKPDDRTTDMPDAKQPARAAIPDGLRELLDRVCTDRSFRTGHNTAMNAIDELRARLALEDESHG